MHKKGSDESGLITANAKRTRLRQSRIQTNEIDTANILWGDEPPNTTQSCRLLFQNVNGISRFNDFGDAHEVGMAAEDIGVDILGLAETNLDWQADGMKQGVQSVFRKYWKHSKMGVTSSDHRLESEYQPGGALLLIGQPWSGRASVNHDESGLGRWVEATLRGKENRQITVMCAYQVIKNSISKCGPSTAFAQQWHMLRLSGVTTPDPNKQFLDDLGTRIDALKEDEHEVIVMMDANDSLQNPRSNLTTWARNHSLIDVHVQRHGTDEEPPTFARGSKRIDYILMTGKLTEFVTAAGILPLNDFCPSDHRAVFADVAIHEYLKGEPSPLANSSGRALQSNDPRAVKKYREALEKYLDDNLLEHNVDKTIRTLDATGYNEEMADTLNNIDAELTKARLECEAQCARIKSHPWSPLLMKAKKTVSYWKLWMSEIRLKRDMSAQREKTLSVKLQVAPTITEANSALKTAQQELKAAILNAKELRRNHLLERAGIAKTLDQNKVEKAIKYILRSEAQKEMFNRLRRIMKGENSGTLSHIQVVDESGAVRNVYDQNEINDLLIERNAKHFSQADGTPFTVAPIASLFGRYGTNEISKRILDGNFAVEELETTDAVRTLLKEVKRAAPEGSVNAHISAADIRAGYKKWRESTTTSPSGLHLGHEKAIMKYEEEGGESALSERIFSLKAKLLNVAIEYGHVYSRWKTIVNAMIEKTPGKPVLNKLRVIHLIESDFNLMTGILWGRRLMSQGEKLNQFGDEQGGSRTDRRAQEILLFKHIAYSVVRLTKTNCATFDNDAKSCYDRIVMLAASLCSQRLGMAPKACELFLKTLDEAKYHVKTNLGISTEFYNTTDERNIHGPGQGGRSSPSIWTIISCILMKCMRTKTDGATFSDPTREISVNRICSGFVDDITHIVNSFQTSLHDKESLAELGDKTRSSAQWWEELLNATGGKLELQKCFFYLMFWRFDGEGVAHLVTKSEGEYSVRITDSESKEEVQIDRKECNEAHKTLGAFETPSGDYKAEINRLINKARKIAQRISSATVSKNEAIVLFRSMFMPSISYSFPAGILSLRDSDRVQGAPVQAILAAMGYNSNMPREVVYGPQESGGIGLHHVFAEQGVLKSISIIQQIRTDRSLGKMIQIQLRWAQRVAGTSTPILENAMAQLPQLTGEKWIETLREFLSLSELGIKVNGIEGIRSKRANDKAIMDIAIQSDLTNDEIRMVNRCRIFLRAECLSDICSADGKSIRRGALECDEEARIQSIEDWPRQPRPGKRHRRTWKAWLESICSSERRLSSSLGIWSCEPARQQWEAYYDPEWDVAIMYDELEKTWVSRSIIEKSRRGWEVSTESWPADFDRDNFIPTDITRRANGTILISEPMEAPWLQQTKRTSPKTWNEYVVSLPSWEKDLIGINHEMENMTGLCSALINESTILFAVSDGGNVGPFGSFGWVVGTTDEIMWEGAGVARGSPMTSYRAEAYGYLALTCFISRFATFMGIEIKCEIRSFCDNLEVIKHVNRNDESAWAAIKADYDVIRQIHVCQATLKRNATKLYPGQHVKGHQEKIMEYHELSRQAILNIHADSIARDKVKEMQSEGDIPEMLELPACKAYLINGNAIQTSQEQWTCRWKWSDLRIQNYHCRRLNVSSQTLHRINWEAFRKARKRLTSAERAFATKMMTRWLPTGHQIQKYGGQVTACHKCGEDETVDHLFQCKGNSLWAKQFTNKLDDYLMEIKTEIDTRRALVSGITRWLNEDLMTKENRCPSSMKQCFKLQGEIGWNLAMCGLLDENWSAYQSAALSETDSQQRVGGVDIEWNVKFSCWLIREARSLWLSRNEAVHTPDEGRSKAEADTLEQVRNLYKFGDEMSQHDRIIFDEPIEEKLRRPIQSLRQWVKNTIPTANKCMRDFKLKLRTRQHDIRSFFRPKPTTSTKTKATQKVHDHYDQTPMQTPAISNRTLGATSRKEHYQAFRRPLPTRDKNQDPVLTTETTTTKGCFPRNKRITMTTRLAQQKNNNMSG